MSVETSDTFGNYLIHGIDEIIVPDAVPWWPLAPGWQLLGLLAGIYFIYLIYRQLKHWWRNRYRREALRQLKQAQDKAKNSADQQLQDVIAQLPYLMKVTALQAYPRKQVAKLTGEHWLNFLDAHYDGPVFSQGIGKKMLSIAYLPPEQWQLSDAESLLLIKMVQRWIKKHKATADV